MSCDIAGQPAPQAYLDDEITALALQLEEINCHDENSKGKHRADKPPDVDVAFSSYQAEVQGHIQFLNDLKLARSIAQAVDTDSQAIAEAMQGESQVQQDRLLALGFNEGENPETEAPPPYSQVDGSTDVQEERLRWIINAFDNSAGDDDEDSAGPSKAYAQRQEKALDSLSQLDSKCCVCYDRFRRCDAYRLQCGDIYCADCLKGLFMRSTKDEELFPPRCCRQPIPLGLIAGRMAPEELNIYQIAEVELSTHDRTYCCNTDCSNFIPPKRITADRANCESCGTETCLRCKHSYHYRSDCPEDPALQATLDLAGRAGWRRCFRCRTMVELNRGCYHMT